MFYFLSVQRKKSISHVFIVEICLSYIWSRSCWIQRRCQNFHLKLFLLMPNDYMASYHPKCKGNFSTEWESRWKWSCYQMLDLFDAQRSMLKNMGKFYKPLQTVINFFVATTVGGSNLGNRNEPISDTRWCDKHVPAACSVEGWRASVCGS